MRGDIVEIGVEIGIGDGKAERNRVPVTAADQFRNREPACLPGNVEQRGFKRSLRLRAADDGPVRRRHVLPDLQGVLAQQVRAQMDMEGCRAGLDGAGEDGPGRRLAPAGEAAICHDFENRAVDAPYVAAAMGVNRLDRDIDDMDPQPFDPLAAHAVRPCGMFVPPKGKATCRAIASAPFKRVPESPFVMVPVRCLLNPAALAFDNAAARCV